MLQAFQLNEISRDKISFSIAIRKCMIWIWSSTRLSKWCWKLIIYSGFDWLRAPSSQHQFEYMLEQLNKIQTIVWFLPIHIFFYFTTDGRLPYFTQTHYSEKYEQIKILNLFCPAGEIFLHFKLFQKSDLGWWNIGSSKVKKRSNIPGSLDVMFPSGQWSWILISCITPPNTLE